MMILAFCYVTMAPLSLMSLFCVCKRLTRPDLRRISKICQKGGKENVRQYLSLSARTPPPGFAHSSSPAAPTIRSCSAEHTPNADSKRQAGFPPSNHQHLSRNISQLQTTDLSTSEISALTCASSGPVHFDRPLIQPPRRQFPLFILLFPSSVPCEPPSNHPPNSHTSDIPSIHHPFVALE